MRKAVIIYLLCQIAGMNCDPTSLATAAACIECGIPPGMQDAVIIYLLCQIANSGGTSAPDYISYAGPPTTAPPALQYIVVDVEGRQWMYWNNQWQ
jgi:hypothetical protein